MKTKIIDKKVLVTIISLINAMLFSILSVSIFNLIEIKNAKDNQVNAAYLITDAVELAKNYSSYTDFEINSLDGLSAFASLCYYYSQSVASKTDYSWKGKKIVLKADVDCGGGQMLFGMTSLAGGRITTDPTFAGTFDGNGKTISNFTIASSSSTRYVQTGGARAYILGARGLFLKVSGKIENLRLVSAKTDDIGLSAGGGGVMHIDQAALVGVLSGTVTNCVVEGFTGAYQASGIAAASFGGTINNCYVSGVVPGLIDYGYGIGPIRSSVPTGDTTTKAETCTISHCITKEIANISPLTYTYCYSEANKTGGLDLVDVWYYNELYKDGDGYPRLRKFMSFTTYSFSSDANGSVNISSVVVPSDANYYPTISGDTVSIYGQNVKATPKNASLYVFDKWTVLGNSYTASFKKVQYKVTFSTSVSNMSKQSGNNEYLVDPNTQISVQFNKETNVITYSIGVNTITYKIINTYTLKEYDTKYNSTNITVTGNITINPTAKLKSYTPSFS